MDEEIDRAKGGLNLGKGGVHGGIIGHIGLNQQLGPNTFGQRTHPPLQTFAHIAKGQFCALGGQLRGNAPSNGVVIGNAHDQALLALHQLALGQIIFVSHGVSFARRSGASISLRGGS